MKLLVILFLLKGISVLRYPKGEGVNFVTIELLVCLQFAL